MVTFKIIRKHFKDSESDLVIDTNLTQEEAMEHCRDSETSSSTCREANNVAYTEKHGAWFDTYDIE